jgi:hypothetical protein
VGRTIYSRNFVKHLQEVAGAGDVVEGVSDTGEMLGRRPFVSVSPEFVNKHILTSDSDSDSREDEDGAQRRRLHLLRPPKSIYN